MTTYVSPGRVRRFDLVPLAGEKFRYIERYKYNASDAVWINLGSKELPMNPHYAAHVTELERLGYTVEEAP